MPRRPQVVLTKTYVCWDFKVYNNDSFLVLQTLILGCKLSSLLFCRYFGGKTVSIPMYFYIILIDLNPPRLIHYAKKLVSCILFCFYYAFNLPISPCSPGLSSNKPSDERCILLILAFFIKS